jgi:hypothetical protein
MVLRAISATRIMCMVSVGRIHWWLVQDTYFVHFAVQSLLNNVELL